MYNQFTTDVEEKNLDASYVQAKNCPVCNSDDLSFCWTVYYENPKHTEIVKECLYCGEIFGIVYDKNKNVLETKNNGYCDPERTNWLRKQKLAKLLEEP